MAGGQRYRVELVSMNMRSSISQYEYCALVKQIYLI